MNHMQHDIIQNDGKLQAEQELQRKESLFFNTL